MSGWLAFALSLSVDVALPPLAWADLLPSRVQCQAALSLNWNCRCLIRQQHDLQQWREDLHELARDTELRRKAWDLADDAQNTFDPAWKRRLALKRLMDLAGWGFLDLCQQRMPLPVPWQGD